MALRACLPHTTAASLDAFIGQLFFASKAALCIILLRHNTALAIFYLAMCTGKPRNFTCASCTSAHAASVILIVSLHGCPCTFLWSALQRFLLCFLHPLWMQTAKLSPSLDLASTLVA